MRVVYSLVVGIVGWCLPIIGWFVPKIKAFHQQRKSVFHEIAAWQKHKSNKPVLWLHCASLGEYEMVVPLISSDQIQSTYEVVVSFFSASGYNHAKTTNLVSCKFYLPLDKRRVMTKLVKEVAPQVFVLVKYDFWLNHLRALNALGCRLILVNGMFRDKQFITSVLAKVWRLELMSFSRLYVLDEASKRRLAQMGFQDVELSRDLRYDRVMQIQSTKQTIPRIAQFVKGEPALILGSSWPEEENIVFQYLKKTGSKIKVIIAPHDISKQHIENIEDQFKDYGTCLFTDTTERSSDQVFILNTIGLLSSAYQYATIAFIGGGYGKGLHNVLEAAVYGLPIFTGPTINRYPEAVALQKLGTLYTVDSDGERLVTQLKALEQQPDHLNEIKTIKKLWFDQQRGQTKVVQDYILSETKKN